MTEPPDSNEYIDLEIDLHTGAAIAANQQFIWNIPDLIQPVATDKWFEEILIDPISRLTWQHLVHSELQKQEHEDQHHPAQLNVK